MLTDEQRKAIEWAIGMASQHNIHNSSLRALLAAHSAGAQEPVAWAVYNGWSKIAFYISEEGARDHAKAAQRSHDLSGSLAAFRVVPLYTHPQPMPQTDAARDVLAERHRQIEVEGFSPTHDSKQTPGDLARAAACYAMHAAGVHTAETHPPSIWPRNWSVRWWKPDVSRRDLVKAAALILAEIERLDRAGKEAK